MSPVRHCEFPTTVLSVDSVLDQDPFVCVLTRLHMFLFVDQGMNGAKGNKEKRELHRTE